MEMFDKIVFYPDISNVCLEKKKAKRVDLIKTNEKRIKIKIVLEVRMIFSQFFVECKAMHTEWDASIGKVITSLLFNMHRHINGYFSRRTKQTVNRFEFHFFNKKLTCRLLRKKWLNFVHRRCGFQRYGWRIISSSFPFQTLKKSNKIIHTNRNEHPTEENK